MRLGIFGRDGLRLLSTARVGVGVAMLARPELLPRTVGVDRGTAQRVSWLTRMVGAREVALGAGTLLALRRGEHLRGWALGAVLSDATDSLVFAGAVRRGHAHPVLGSVFALTAGLGAATGITALRDED